MIQISPQTYILSLGGSIIVPQEGIDLDFLRLFKKFIEDKVSKGNKFIIVCGGGSTCRRYRDAAREINSRDINDEDLDWIGIYATWLNALLVKNIFKNLAYPEVLTEFDDINPQIFQSPIIIAGGGTPGHSSDYDAVLLAKKSKASTIINLSNINMVYDSDPQENPNAQPQKVLSWKKFLEIVGTDWQPGMSAPFDPIASRKCQEWGLKVIVCNGKDIPNLNRCLNKEDFIGTTITDE